MSFRVYTDPFGGMAASVVTSHILDCRDAFDISLSWYTTSGTSSMFTYQVSGSSLELGSDGSSIAAGSWSNWTFVLLPSGASVMEPPLGVPYARILRTVSGASIQMDWNKLVYGP